MPTKSWIAKRRQHTFWLSKEESRQFIIACERENKSQADVLRETVQLLIASAEVKP